MEGDNPEGEPPQLLRPTTEVSSTRIYLGNLPRDVTKEEISEYFKNGPGNIVEMKLMTGFGFLEFDDPADARDVVPALIAPDGNDFKGQRITVQFARGARPRSEYQNENRPGPRPRRTAFRMSLLNLPEGTSWQDLKDFARRPGLDVVYSEVSRGDGRGFVEYETSNDLRSAVEKLNETEFKGTTVKCVSDEQAETPSYGGGGGGGGYRNRSRSPRGYGRKPYDDYYHRSGPPRGYSPRRDDYRRRTPPPHEDYYGRERYRSPPRMRGPPPEEPYPPRGYRGDPYAHPPPPRDYRDDPYANGYDRPPPPRRADMPPPRGGGYGYDDRPPRYW